MIDAILNRLRLIVGRCIITATRYNDGELLADAEFLADENRRNMEFLQQYGYSSRPKGVVSGVAVFVGGNRDNGAIIATNGEEMGVKLEPGEVCVHSPFGSSILLKNDGSVEIKAASGKNIVCTGGLEVSGDLTAQNVNAKLEVAANTMAVPVHLSTHTHVCASPGSPTAVPLG